MYDINYKNVKKQYIFGTIFLIIGLILLIAFSFMLFFDLYKKTTLDSSIKALKIEEKCDDDECIPIYSFKVDGKLYTCKPGFSSNIKVTKNQNMVYYDSKNPNNCVTDYTIKMNKLMYLILIIPILFILIGIIDIIYIKQKVKKLIYLSKNGQLIKNLPYELKPTHIRINGRVLMAINIEYTTSQGTNLKLKGNPIFNKLQEQEYVDLLIDPLDNKNYYIDFNIQRKY